MRESKIEAYLVKRVKESGGEVRKVQWIGRKQAPDRLVMLGDRFTKDPPRWTRPLTIWVELKATGEEPTKGQLREHERMRELGQRVEVIDSFEGVDKLLET